MAHSDSVTTIPRFKIMTTMGLSGSRMQDPLDAFGMQGKSMARNEVVKFFWEI